MNPNAIKVMAEAGVDITAQRSKHVHEVKDVSLDYVVTVCDDANESCPIFPNATHRLHWSLPDPSRATGIEERQLATYRTVRDELRKRIEMELLSTEPSPGRRVTRIPSSHDG